MLVYVSIRKPGLTVFVWNVSVPASTLVSRSCDTVSDRNLLGHETSLRTVCSSLDSSSLQQEFLTSPR